MAFGLPTQPDIKMAKPPEQLYCIKCAKEYATYAYFPRDNQGFQGRCPDCGFLTKQLEYWRKDVDPQVVEKFERQVSPHRELWDALDSLL